MEESGPKMEKLRQRRIPASLMSSGSQGDPQATVLSPAQSKTSLSFSPSWNDMVGKGPPICPQSNRATSLDMQMAVVNWPARAIALRKELFWLV
ncbi:Hypothetical predicted protein [Podarcis lilfordi]|uniref:Uncharacterized protein n=1 Tax=Podarcis lilfordi TaxID=74358 RepID=A0AA35PRE9_9SAUR|nr:Hypothetical predicted protein [Podarcis lilfordi]